MDFTQLSKILLEKASIGERTSSIYPSSLYFPSHVSKILKSMSGYTNKESFANKTGPVGWEYAASVLFIFDSLYISDTHSGNYESVMYSHKYSFKPEYLNNNTKLRFNIQFDNKKYTSKLYDPKNLGSRINHGITASFHTHPKYYHNADLWQYTFFSGKDIATLLGGRTPVQGLIMGKDIWLACKTNSSTMVQAELLNQASKIELHDGMKGLKSFVSSNLKDSGIVFYHGSVGGKLNKV